MIDDNRYQFIDTNIIINRLILEIDEQLTYVLVIIQLTIDFQYQSIKCDRFIDCHRLSSVLYFIQSFTKMRMGTGTRERGRGDAGSGTSKNI